jgi:hypothetical protein
MSLCSGGWIDRPPYSLIKMGINLVLFNYKACFDLANYK